MTRWLPLERSATEDTLRCLCSLADSPPETIPACPNPHRPRPTPLREPANPPCNPPAPQPPNSGLPTGAGPLSPGFARFAREQRHFPASAIPHSAFRTFFNPQPFRRGVSHQIRPNLRASPFPVPPLNPQPKTLNHFWRGVSHQICRNLTPAPRALFHPKPRPSLSYAHRRPFVISLHHSITPTRTSARSWAAAVPCRFATARPRHPLVKNPVISHNIG
ncbi:MAG: hypothetical protein JWQ04_2169 [Pedosphaera sp.]|nr:hypothetical protein [Pedosphaera sp.]